MRACAMPDPIDALASAMENVVMRSQATDEEKRRILHIFAEFNRHMGDRLDRVLARVRGGE